MSTTMRENKIRFEVGNFRKLKLTHQILHVIEKVIKNFIRQQSDVNEVQFVFMTGHGNAGSSYRRNT